MQKKSEKERGERRERAQETGSVASFMIMMFDMCFVELSVKRVINGVNATNFNGVKKNIARLTQLFYLKKIIYFCFYLFFFGSKHRSSSLTAMFK